MHQEGNVRQQDALKKESRDQVMLPGRNLSPQVQEELARSQLSEDNHAMPDFLGPAQEMALIGIPMDTESIGTIDQVL